MVPGRGIVPGALELDHEAVQHGPHDVPEAVRTGSSLSLRCALPGPGYQWRTRLALGIGRQERAQLLQGLISHEDRRHLLEIVLPEVRAALKIAGGAVADAQQ